MHQVQAHLWGSAPEPLRRDVHQPRLIVDLTDTLTTADLRDAWREAFPDIYVMVIEAKGPLAWSGFGAKTGPADMFTWMHETWDRDG